MPLQRNHYEKHTFLRKHQQQSTRRTHTHNTRPHTPHIPPHSLDCHTTPPPHAHYSPTPSDDTSCLNLPLPLLSPSPPCSLCPPFPPFPFLLPPCLPFPPPLRVLRRSGSPSFSIASKRGPSCHACSTRWAPFWVRRSAVRCARLPKCMPYGVGGGGWGEDGGGVG